MANRLEGKIVAITGGSQGIGYAIAQRFAQEGADISFCYRSNTAGADEVAASIKKFGRKCVDIRCDVGIVSDGQKFIADTVAQFGRIDILVNNAGVYRFEPLEQVTEDEFHREFNTNVLGTILSTREAIKYFGPDGGSVINISSVASTLTPPQSVVYSATKSALDGVTRVLAKELGSRNIRVNSINPGGVETEGTHSSGIVGSDFANQMIARTPLGRFGQPEDIAPIAVFLASPESSWLTGEIITASGGLS